MDAYSIRRMEREQQRAGQTRLADAIRARRSALGLTQRDVVAAGGPALSTLRQIEAAKSPGGLSRETTLGLDRSLRWTPGTAAKVLAGAGEISQLDTAGWPTASGDWAAYVQQRQCDEDDGPAFPAAVDGPARDAVTTGIAGQSLETYSDAQLIAELARRLAERRTGEGG